MYNKTHMPCLTHNLLTTTIVAPPSNASKWQMGFNSAFKGLTHTHKELLKSTWDYVRRKRGSFKARSIFILSLDFRARVRFAAKFFLPR